MIDLPFDPNLTFLGPFTLSWHGIFSVVGIVAGVWLAIRLAGARIPEERAYSIATWGVVGGIVGARLFHVVDQWHLYANDPLQVFAIWNGGIAIRGAVTGGVLAGYFRALQLKAPIGFAADAAAPGIALGTAIGRIGDIINGEHHAVGCADLPWCVRYTHAATLGQGPYHAPPAGFGYVHPAVAYEMVILLGVVALLLALRPRFVGPSPEGRLFWLFMGLYGLEGFLVSFLRLDAIWFLGLRQAQLVSLALLAASVAMLAYLSARRGVQTERIAR